MSDVDANIILEYIFEREDANSERFKEAINDLTRTDVLLKYGEQGANIFDEFVKANPWTMPENDPCPECTEKANKVSKVYDEFMTLFNSSDMPDDIIEEYFKLYCSKDGVSFCIVEEFLKSKGVILDTEQLKAFKFKIVWKYLQLNN